MPLDPTPAADSGPVGPRATLADLIDRYEANRMALEKAEADLIASDRVLSEAIQATRQVEHGGRRYWANTGDRYPGVSSAPTGILHDLAGVPDARDVVVPAEVLGEPPV